MTEQTQDQGDTAVAEAPVAVKAPKAKRIAAVVQLVNAAGETFKATKYPMPLKGAPYELTINGERCAANQTTFGEIRYTYVTVKGCSFYCPGHHADDQEYTFEAPEGYSWEPLKLDRKAQSTAAAAAKAAKAAAAAPTGEEGADAGDASDPAGVETGAATEGSASTSEAATARESAPKRGKKSQA